jgi:hypothetical protein
MTTGSKVMTGIVFLALVAGSARGFAETIQLSPSKDNTLYEDDFGSTSNGQGQFFFAGRTDGGSIRRGLIAFDIACNIPPGSTIESVTLTLHVSRAHGVEIAVDLHAARVDWGEGASMAIGEEGGGAPAEPGDATWLHTFYDNQRWTTSGGDFSPVITSNSAVTGTGFYTFDSMYDPGLVSDVQRWLEQPDANFGWVLVVGDESFPRSAKRFDSRENGSPEFQPSLTVTYSTGVASLLPDQFPLAP